MLLQHGANYTICNKNGDTILHYSAQSGSLQTLNVLRDANLIGIDPYARNSKGQTAFELAQQCEAKPEGFIDLFMILLFEIRNRNDHLARHQNHGSGTIIEEIYEADDAGHEHDPEEFFDAQEH